MTRGNEITPDKVASVSAEQVRQDHLEHLVDELKTLRDGERTVIEITSCGPDAIPPLRRLLFGREPSGLYQPRCLAIDALAALKAHDVLIEFLKLNRLIEDPIERTGEEAVVNRAARALIAVPSEPTYQLLYGRALTKPFAGVIEALGEYRRSAAIPLLIAALGEDDCRLAAETALRQMGSRAVPALAGLAMRARSADQIEYESSIRARERALSLLAAAPLSALTPVWPKLKPLTRHPNPRIVLKACEIGARLENNNERLHLIRTAIDLLPAADWLTRAEVEDFLYEYIDAGRPIFETAIARARSYPARPGFANDILATLQRVVKRASASEPDRDRR